MQISNLRIKNFRGLDIAIDTIEKVSIIIGQNDSGKTNICAAILKVLDYNKRRIPFTMTDSTNSNKDDIEIEITLTADNLTNEQLALIGNYIHVNDDKKYIKVKLISKFNEETLEYEDTMYYGNTEMDFEEIRINSQTQLDKVLAIVYINPVYNVETSKSFFNSSILSLSKYSIHLSNPAYLYSCFFGTLNISLSVFIYTAIPNLHKSSFIVLKAIPFTAYIPNLFSCILLQKLLSFDINKL